MTVRQVALGDLITATCRSEGVTPEGEYAMMGVRSFGGGAFDAGQLRGNDTSYPTLRQVKAGDVVYPKLMAWEGAFAVVPAELNDRFVSPEFCVFEVDRFGVSRAYLRHLLSWDGFRQQLGGHSVGTNARRRRLHPDLFLDHQIPLPEIDEQRRIATHLDALESGSAQVRTADDASHIAEHSMTEQLIASQRDSPRVVLADVLRLDRSWFEPQDGQSYSPVGVHGFGRGLIRYPLTPRTELPKLRFFRLRADRLFVSNIKAWEGAVAVTDRSDANRIGSNRFLMYEPEIARVDLAYMQAYLLSEDGLAQLQAASPGSADRNRTLSITNFESIEMPLPTIEVQRGVVRMLRTRDRLADLLAVRAKVAQALPVSARNEIFSAMV